MNSIHFIPMTKVDTARREVWGVAAEEAPDAANEIMDYTASKPYFEAWSARFAKRTGGRSLGNVRAMHSPVAAGKIIHFEPNDARKIIYIGAQIVDDAEWAKVEAGVYTGFSIGGSYAKRWPDPQNPQLMRYAAIPTEISLVDNPCMRGATFELVRGDGMARSQQFREVTKMFDLEERAMRAREAWYVAHAPQDEEARESFTFYVRAVLDDRVIVEQEGKLYSYPYTLSEAGAFSFGEPTEVEHRYVPVGDTAPLEENAPESSAESEESVPAEPQADAAEAVEEEEPMQRAAYIDGLVKVQQAMQQQLDALQKTIDAQLEELRKPHDTQITSQMTALASRVAALEKQPAGDQPVLRVVAGMEKTTPSPVKQAEYDRLYAQMLNEPNPVLRAEYQRQLFVLESQFVK